MKNDKQPMTNPFAEAAFGQTPFRNPDTPNPPPPAPLPETGRGELDRKSDDLSKYRCREAGRGTPERTFVKKTNAMRRLTSTILPLLLSLLFCANTQSAGLKVGDMCRIKGQETNTLQGLGLVVGLSGTGDSGAAPTARALARMMQLMGGPMGVNSSGQLDLTDVADAKNVAMVFVTATVPETGAQSGDLLDIEVNAINAKSLEGGTLMLTPLLGPRADNPTVYAMAQGRLNVSLDGPATTGRVQGGAKMESTISASYLKDGMLTLILDRDFASFANAYEVENQINSMSSLAYGGSFDYAQTGEKFAKAIDQLHVRVRIPDLYRDDQVKFIRLLLDADVQVNSKPSRVVINERDGVVVIGEEVEIAPVLVTHRNLRIEAGRAGGLLPVSDKDNVVSNAKLKSLADALNALDVPTEDLIAIIKTLKRKGDLFGEVIYE